MHLALPTLLALLSIAVITDIWSRKIPNIVIAIGMMLGLILQALTPEGTFLELSLAVSRVLGGLGGMGLGLIALFPLYLMRAMGAGDVKLMMMVGAFLGPLQTLGVVVLTFAAGGVFAIGMALWQRSFRQLVFNLRFMLTTSAISAASGASPKFEPLQQTAGRMPYAVAIAAGTLIQLYLVRNGGWALS